MKIILRSGSNIPIFEQIKNGIKENIISGGLEDGEQLPSVRTLSKELKISILTVKKAYDELAQEGFIDIRQGLGTFVSENNSVLKLEEKQKKMEDFIIEAVKISSQIKIDKQEFLNVVEYLYEVENNGKQD